MSEALLSEGEDRMAVVYHNTHLANGSRAFWQAYFDCLSMDARDGIKTTDDERQRFVRMWERGTVVWRDDGGLLASYGIPRSAVPDAVWITPAGLDAISGKGG